MNTLVALQNWYQAQCNGDWEVYYGVNIDTIDQGGWSVTIDLVDTALAKQTFQPINLNEKSNPEWLQCQVSKQQFLGKCAPHMLSPLLQHFLDWANKNT